MTIPEQTRRLLFASAIYAAVGILLMGFFRHQINPDGISYVSIAQKYVHGDYRDAINGFWGPLLSFLLVPFLRYKLDPLVAVKILSLLIGALTITGLGLLSRRFPMEEKVRSLVLASCIPIVLHFSYSVITPDLLLTSLLIYYLAFITDPGYAEHPWRGIVCGLLGGLAYLAKGYAFPFFVAHFVFANGLHYGRAGSPQDRKGVVKSFAFGIAFFFVLAGPWVSLLAGKYGEWTVGRAGKYNHALMAPGSPGYFYGQLHYRVGFIPPPNETAISAWEDPSLNGNLETWSPLDSWESFAHQGSIVLENAYNIILSFQSFSPLAIIILIAYLLECLPPDGGSLDRPQAVLMTGTVALFSLGYVFFHVEERYLWLCCLLLLLMGGSLTSTALRHPFFSRKRRVVLLLVFSLSFIAMPVKEIARNVHAGRDVYRMSRVLEAQKLRGKVASNDNWQKTLYLSYYLGLKYYGVARGNMQLDEIERELKRHGIDYYFLWGPEAADSVFWRKYREVTGGGIGELRIYSITDGSIAPERSPNHALGPAGRGLGRSTLR